MARHTETVRHRTVQINNATRWAKLPVRTHRQIWILRYKLQSLSFVPSVALLPTRSLPSKQQKSLLDITPTETKKEAINLKAKGPCLPHTCMSTSSNSTTTKTTDGTSALLLLRHCPLARHPAYLLSSHCYAYSMIRVRVFGVAGWVGNPNGCVGVNL